EDGIRDYKVMEFRRVLFRSIHTRDFDFYRARGLTVFFPAHFDLSVRVALQDRGAADGMHRDSPSTGDESDDAFTRERMATKRKEIGRASCRERVECSVVVAA